MSNVQGRQVLFTVHEESEMQLTKGPVLDRHLITKTY